MNYQIREINQQIEKVMELHDRIVTLKDGTIKTLQEQIDDLKAENEVLKQALTEKVERYVHE